MQLIDTHCHIQSAGLTVGERSTRELWAKDGNATVDELIKRANAVGVDKMICVGCDLDDSKLAVTCVKSRENLYASIGLHPHEAQHYVGKPELLDDFASLASSPKVVAVGECGLDYFYEHSPKNAQIPVLEYQLQVALDHKLPVIFHVRGAFDDFWPVFFNFSGLRGVLHSFTDSTANMQKAVDQGLFIGVNGIATFTKNADQLDMYRAIPAQNLLLETDAPFLTPVPLRGKICEPQHVALTAGFLAELRGVGKDEIAAQTTQNAQTLFNL